MQVSVITTCITERDELYHRIFDGDDSAFPVNMSEARERSIDAVRKCYPKSAHRMPAKGATAHTLPGYYRVEAAHGEWTVTWRNSARIESDKQLLKDIQVLGMDNLMAQAVITQGATP